MTKFVKIGMTREQKIKIMAAAVYREQSVSEYIRERVLFITGAKWSGRENA
jgi:hypothetical protein